MLNQAVLVGRVAEIGNLNIKIKVSRSYKNSEGDYETDLIPVFYTNNIAKSAREYLEIDDIIGIKGRLEVEDGVLQVKAEKMTFLSSHKNN